MKRSTDIQFTRQTPPGYGVVNSQGFDPEPFISDDDREFVARCWIAILLFCAVSWVTIIKFIVLPLLA